MIFGISLLFFIGSFPSFSAEMSQRDSNSISREEVILVDDDGDGDYTSIQEAVNNSNPGDIIEIYSGTYNEYNIVISHPISLIGISHEFGGGNDTGKPIIKQFLFLDEIYTLIDVLSNYVSIRECIFQPYNETDYNGCGIYLKNSNYCTISDNEFHGMGGGISFTGSPNTVIQNNSINNADSIGIYMWSSYNSTIRNNTISNIGWNGIDINFNLETPYNCSIVDNHISNCSVDGIYADGSGIIITDNVIENCLNNGISSVSFGSLIHNRISNCSKGINVICSSNMIKENLVVDCIVGMKILCQGESTLIENNEIRNSITGMNIDEPDVYMVNITRNNFIQNKIQTIFTAINPLLCNSIWSENYWGNTLSHPKSLFGFGILLFAHSEYPIGVPVPWICFDMRPAQEPYNIPGMR
jgi:parallel beta-helix repeat protein